MNTPEIIGLIVFVCCVCLSLVWLAYENGYRDGHARGYLDAMKHYEDSTWKWTK